MTNILNQCLTKPFALKDVIIALTGKSSLYPWLERKFIREKRP